MSHPKIAVLLAPGFEEVEAAAPIDVLRRLGFEVQVAGVGVDGHGREVAGSHGLAFKVDCLLSEVKASQLLAVVLPGGFAGATHLRDSAEVIKLVKEVHAAGRLVAAICAAPLVLDKAGLLENKKFTCYPGVEAQIHHGTHTGARIERDGQILTGKGPGAAIEFGLAIGTALGKGPEAEQLRLAMIVD